jgi:positive phototaxis protein PixI
MSDALSLADARPLPVRVQDLEMPVVDEQFLRIHLVPDTTALLPAHDVTEVLNIPLDRIIPVPHMPAWVMGIYNWRGEVLWMVDLGHLCGLTPWHQQAATGAAHTAVVMQIRTARTTPAQQKPQVLGLIVNRVEDTEQCNPSLIQTPPSSGISPDLLQFLRGFWWKSDDTMLAVMDSAAIFSAMPK